MFTGAGAIAFLTNKRTWYIAASVALAIVVAVIVGNWVQTRSENTVLTTKLEQVSDQRDQLVANQKANAKALATRNELITALAQVETVERVRTVKALEANPAWANQPIPADVLASLRD